MKTRGQEGMVPDDQVRRIMLQYFYDRNKNAVGVRSKKAGAAVTISILRADLKVAHGLSRQQVVSNLTYLLSQGWVEEKPLSKSFPTPKGSIVPSVTTYYIITAAGIDKIDGPSEFTRDPFHGIRIEATGQNIITVGDGNHVAARFQHVGEALAQLADAIKASGALDDARKLDLVSDVNTIQAQLTRHEPNRGVIRTLWAGLKSATEAVGLVEATNKVAALLSGLV